ncbi:hypothetical protein DFAR_740008 [Desulfarculales bacterium]
MVQCLTGKACSLVWLPGLIRPGEQAVCQPWDLTPLVMELLELTVPPAWPSCLPSGR